MRKLVLGSCIICILTAGSHSAAAQDNPMDVFRPFIGNWTTASEMGPTAANPEKSSGTGELTGTMILGDRFVQMEGSQKEWLVGEPIGHRIDHCDAMEVRAAWSEFKRGSLDGKGELVANRVTAATLVYYDELRRLALEATKPALAKEEFGKRLTVLIVRLRVPAEQLRNMSGRDLFIHAIEQGWIGRESLTYQDIGAIKINGDHARAEATRFSRRTGMYFHFAREDGEWRLDMLQMMEFVNVSFDTSLEDSGLTEEEFTKQILSKATGKPVTRNLWIPPGSGD